MPQNGVDRAAGRMIGPNGDRFLFIYPETSFLLFLPSRLCKEGSIPLHRISAHLFFQCHVNETLSPSMPKDKTELLKSFEQCASVIDGDILKGKANLKVHACSKKVFQNSDKKTQDNTSII